MKCCATMGAKRLGPREAEREGRSEHAGECGRVIIYGI